MKIKPEASNVIYVTTDRRITYRISDSQELGLQIRRADMGLCMKVSSRTSLENTNHGEVETIYLDKEE